MPWQIRWNELQDALLVVHGTVTAGVEIPLAPDTNSQCWRCERFGSDGMDFDNSKKENPPVET